MEVSRPSRTALRVAMRRAAHGLVDAPPLVLEDPFALRILPSPQQAEVRARTPLRSDRVQSMALRAWVLARARFAEDVLATAVRERGTRQYLLLGAGLDTFAWRNPHPRVRVFEVDHPATQVWKRECLKAAGMPESAVTFVPVDFERDSLRERLSASGLDPGLPVVTAWLGVVPYLTEAAFSATLGLLGEFACGSDAVFDYVQPREVLPAVEQLMRDSLSARVHAAGEPFLLFQTPGTLAKSLERAGLAPVQDLGSRQLSERYFTGRSDRLEPLGVGGRLCQASLAW